MPSADADGCYSAITYYLHKFLEEAVLATISLSARPRPLLLAAISFTARDAKRTAAPPCAWRVGAVSSRGQATPG